MRVTLGMRWPGPRDHGLSRSNPIHYEDANVLHV